MNAKDEQDPMDVDDDVRMGENETETELLDFLDDVGVKGEDAEKTISVLPPGVGSPPEVEKVIQLFDGAEAIVLGMMGFSEGAISKIKNWIQVQRANPSSIVGTNGIDFDSGTVLYREALVSNTFKMFDSHRYCVVGAPPAYGKTSLLQLLEREGIKKGYWVKTCVLSPENLFDDFEANTGIDLRKDVIIDKEPGTQKLILFDEAQRIYGQELFWIKLIKGLHNADQTEGKVLYKNYRFVFAVTYDLSIGGSPASFKDPQMHRITSETMLLSDNESKELWGLLLTMSGLQTWNSFGELRNSVLLNSGGQPGVIVTFFLFLKSYAETAKQGAEQEEKVLLQQLFGKDILSRLERCFSPPRSDEVSLNLKDVLARIFTGRQEIIQTQTDGEKLALRKLIRGGVLKGREETTEGGGWITGCAFTIPAAKRFYFGQVFSERSADAKAPASVGQLVLDTFKHMSAIMLRDSEESSTAKKKFPKEAAFQQFFMAGLTKSLPVTAAVCPEMSKVWGEGKGNDGALDFFINGDLRFGVELLTRNRGTGEHQALFGKGGKYEHLNTKQHVVVDCRPMENGKKGDVRIRNSNLITMFIKEDYTGGEYYWGKQEGTVKFQA